MRRLCSIQPFLNYVYRQPASNTTSEVKVSLCTLKRVKSYLSSSVNGVRLDSLTTYIKHWNTAIAEL